MAAESSMSPGLAAMWPRPGCGLMRQSKRLIGRAAFSAGTSAGGRSGAVEPLNFFSLKPNVLAWRFRGRCSFLRLAMRNLALLFVLFAFFLLMGQARAGQIWLPRKATTASSILAHPHATSPIAASRAAPPSMLLRPNELTPK